MHSLYKKNEILFAIIWIAIYSIVSVTIRNQFGDESIYMLFFLAFVAVRITFFIKKYHLEQKYGLKNWPNDSEKFLYFIPIWILTTGNLWGGVKIVYAPMDQIFATLSMFFIGYIEEVIFRGFLFQGILKKDGANMAIIIVSITFGMGHIINLFSGQRNVETILQILFAISWGFIFTSGFYKSGSLFPFILAHGLIDAFSKFANANPKRELMYIIATIVVAVFYCPYILRREDKKSYHST